MTDIATPRWGKYRGTVINNDDMRRRARLQVSVPELTGASVQVWAEPCLPYAGLACGLVALPPIGASVWIEYERGDINAPIWTGCYWPESGQVPSQVPPTLPFAAITLQVPNGGAIVLSEDPQRGILLRTADGAAITISSQGITLDNGKGAVITVTGNSVDINKGALKVT